MGKKVFLVCMVVASALCACGNDHRAGGDKGKADAVVHKPVSDGSKAGAADTVRDSNPIPGWANVLIADYIKKTGNPLIVAAQKSKASESWLFDQVIPTDTAQYIVLQIGHDAAEPDGSDPRYVTDQWLYIDTVTRKVYEYDVAADSLMLWSGK